MKCTIIRHLGYSPARERHSYVLEAENGIIAQEEAKQYFRIGTQFDLPDEEWSPETEEYDVCCDECGYEYSKKAVPGGVIHCPLCNAEERIPDEQSSER